MDDLLKSAQALAAAMEGQSFVATGWPVCARFCKAVRAATEELRSAEQAQAEADAPSPAPAATDAPAPEAEVRPGPEAQP